MDWLARLNRLAGPYDLGGAQAEVLHWSHHTALPDNRPHRHTYFEVCLVGTHGTGWFHVQDRRFTLAPGTLFVARPGVIHQIENTHPLCMELYWVAYRLSRVPGSEPHRPLTAFAESPLVAVRDEDGRVGLAWHALRSLAPAAGDAALGHLVAGFLLTVSEAFAPAWPDALAQDQGPPVSVRQALRYIQDNLERPIAMEEVARHSGISRRHLARLMRQHTGASFHEYVLCARLHVARHLLRHSDLAVKSVAAQVGYPDVHHFTRVFARHAGCPPAAFRRGESRVPIVQSPGTLV